MVKILLRDDPSIQMDSGTPDGDTAADSREPVSPKSVAPELPPPLNFRILACLWVFVSVGAVYLLFRNPEWRTAPDLLRAFGAVRMEQWVAVLLLVVQGWLIAHAWRSA